MERHFRVHFDQQPLSLQTESYEVVTNQWLMNFPRKSKYERGVSFSQKLDNIFTNQR